MSKKIYVLVAHEAENPFEGNEIPVGVEVRTIGIGESCIDEVNDILREIEEDRREVRILLTGTCGSVLKKQGEVIWYPVWGYLEDEPSNIPYHQGIIISVPEFIASKEDINKYNLDCWDGFDMELSTIIRCIQQSDVGHLIAQFDAIKVVSDNGEDTLGGWEDNTRNLRPKIKEIVSTYLFSEEDKDSDIDLVLRYDDYPKKGVEFLDIFPALTGKTLSGFSIFYMTKTKERCKVVVSPESRGFLLASAVLVNDISSKLIPVRKKGKLPNEGIEFKASKEYGFDTLCMSLDHWYNVRPSESGEIRVSVVDDVLATGGTALAIWQALHGTTVKTRWGSAKILVDSFVFFTEVPHLAGEEMLRNKTGVPVYVFVRV